METNKRHIDGREFVSLITTNQRRIYAYILTLVPNLNDADDIIQETTALMWEKKEDFVPGTDFVAWGARIAYYKILEYRKKASRHRQLLIDDKQFNLLAHRSLPNSKQVEDTIYKVQECLKKLSQSDNHLMHLRYSAGLSAKEIAARINKSIRSVYLNISRIQDLLLKCIERSH